MNAVSSKTLFIRNLPYSTSDSQLEELFFRHGSLKACFTVKEKGTHDRCRGFGYVTYENREDAEKAKSLVKTVGSRPVQIVFAKQREPRKTTKRKKDDAKNKEEADDVTINRDNVASVTINRDSDVSDGEELVETVDQTDSEDDDYEALTASQSGVVGGASNNDWVRGKRKRKTERGDAKFDTGRVVILCGFPEGEMTEMKLRKECERMGKVESIECPVPEREIPSAYITYSTHKEARVAVSQLNGQSFGEAAGSAKVVAQLLSREGKSVSKKSLKKSRLIVRNLSFKCSEDDVRGVFEKYGQLVEVHIPRKPNGHMLGYAFVQFGSYFAAKNAMEAINTTKIKGRPVAVDWVVPKEQYERSVQQEEEEGEGEGGRQEGEEREGEKKMEIEAKDEELDSESDIESHDGDIESHNIDAESRGCDSESRDSDAESHDSDRESHDSGAESGDEVEGDTKRDDVKEGKTLFIRNLPLNVDHKELKQLFYEFGRVRYCRVMFSPDTGLCTGSAFVQFRDASSVRSCLDASSSREQGISYGGQRLEVTFALRRWRGCVRRGRERRGREGERTSETFISPRKEGGSCFKEVYSVWSFATWSGCNKEVAALHMILPGSSAAADLSKTDMARRVKVYSQKKSKLVNPYFFVSRTRLSVHNLPINVDEQRLKRVFLKAVAENIDEARVTQLKILRSSERVNSKGIGRSLGYGFVEFSSHEAALAALRETNNNPAIFGEKRRLIVEFAVEDSRALKLRERRRQRQQMKPAPGISGQAKAAGVDEDKGTDVESETPLSKRQKWRLKCRAKRLRRRERKKISASESTGTEEKGRAKQTKAESAVSFTLPTDNKKQLRNDSAPVISRNRSQTRQGTGMVGGDGGKTQSKNVKVERSDTHPGVKLSRKRKRKGVESSKEEVEFAEMVAKYRRKLQRTST